MIQPKSELILEVEGVAKSFPGVRALRGVNLQLRAGEVLAVIGENGAGKSTLMKILAGVQRPDLGTIRVRGQAVSLDSVSEALRLGISLIHQELNLADNLDVGSNIFLGREPLRHGLIDRRRIGAESRRYLAQVGLEVEPSELVSRLTIGRQQMVEIAKALSVNAQVLIMDEPTSSLSAKEADTLFDVIEQLRGRGVGIIYISHRLGEVERIADRVTVLRDGENAGDLDRDAITHDDMVRLMVGRDISQFYARQQHQIGGPALTVSGLVTPTWPDYPVNFQVNHGEIVGVAGLVGAGRTELLRTLFGVDRRLAGEIAIDGQRVAIRSPQEALAHGVALIPEDRKQHGVLVDMSVRQNISLANLNRHRLLAGFLNRRREADDCREMTRRLNIKTPSAEQIVRFLSGGNQQKVVIGKWLSLKPRVLLLDEPTRGIDIGAKEEIYRLIETLAREGMAILFASSEMEEILGLSDRVLVMHEGRITGELLRDALTEEAVMRLATGNAPLGGVDAVA